MRNQASRSGLTLVEVVLVLALLVVIGSVTVPLVSGSLSRARLQHGGDLVRAAWGNARLAAMRGGTPYMFRCEPNGSRFQVAKQLVTTSDGADEINTLPPEDAAGVEYDEADMLRLGLNRLPEGIVFANSEVAAVAQSAGATAAADGGWSAPIEFFPDGTTSDAAVMLSNAAGQTVRVTLRGLTGISRASEIRIEATP